MRGGGGREIWDCALTTGEPIALKLAVLTQEGSERSNKEQSCLVCLGSLESWSSTRTDWKSAEESLQLGEG